MGTAWKICFVVVVLLARFFKGYTVALPGPTLLYLAMLLHSSVKMVSTMWIGYSVAGLLGAFSVGYLFYKTDWNQFYIMGFLLATKSLVYFCIPWMNQLWQLIVAISVSGFTVTYVTIGFQTSILKIWGPAISRPMINLFYIARSIGAGVAPFIAQPFLVMAYDQAGRTSDCTSSSSIYSTLTLNQTYRSNTEKIMNPVGWTYVIGGSGLLQSGIFLIILGLTKEKDDMAKENKFAEKREEEQLRDIWWLLLPFVSSFSCSFSYKYAFPIFIYSICVCSEFNFSISDATDITSLYGLGIIIGGMTGGLVGIRVSPQNVSLISVACHIVVMVFFIIFGRSWRWVAWAASFFNGFFTGPLSATVTTWLAQVTNITGKYMSLSVFSGTIAYSVFLPLGGVIFQQSPFGVLYFFLGLSCANAACTVVAACCAKRCKKIKNATEECQLLLE